MGQYISATVQKKRSLSWVLQRLEKINLLSHLLRFTLISHLLGTSLSQTKNHLLLSAANNLSVAFFVLSHIQRGLSEGSNDGWAQTAEMDKMPHAAVCF